MKHWDEVTRELVQESKHQGVKPDHNYGLLCGTLELHFRKAQRKGTLKMGTVHCTDGTRVVCIGKTGKV